MAGLPTNVGHGTVTGRFLSAEQVPGSDPEIDAVPMLGSVTFTPSAAYLLNASANVVIVGAPVTVNLDGTGAFTTMLVATDDVDLNPVDWTYEVLVRFASGQRLTLSIGVPTGGVVDLSRVVPVATSTGTLTVVGPQGEPGPQGVQGEPGVADDPSVAVVLTGPGQSRTVLDTTYVGKTGAPTTAWAEPAVGAGWTIQGAPYEIPRYRKFLGIVFIEGLLLNNSGGALTPAATIFTLPAGLRPRAVVNTIPFSAAGLEIASNGDLRVNNSIPNGTFLSLTISFVPDQ